MASVSARSSFAWEEHFGAAPALFDTMPAQVKEKGVVTMATAENALLMDLATVHSFERALLKMGKADAARALLSYKNRGAEASTAASKAAFEGAFHAALKHALTTWEEDPENHSTITSYWTQGVDTSLVPDDI